MCYQPLFLPFRPSHIKIKGHPRAPAPSMLYPASDIDWRFNSYMIVCTTKENISKVKRQPSEWEKIIANKANDKELMSKIYMQNS